MERREFVQSVGSSVVLALSVLCLGSCDSENPFTPGGPVDFTLDLTQPANAVLLNVGAYIITNNCVVARGIDGKYYAATVICTHEGFKNVQYDKQNNDYHCTAHDSRFKLNGAVQNGPAERGLTIYTVELSGNNLRVHS